MPTDKLPEPKSEGTRPWDGGGSLKQGGTEGVPPSRTRCPRGGNCCSFGITGKKECKAKSRNNTPPWGGGMGGEDPPQNEGGRRSLGKKGRSRNGKKTETHTSREIAQHSKNGCVC